MRRPQITTRMDGRTAAPTNLDTMAFRKRTALLRADPRWSGASRGAIADPCKNVVRPAEPRAAQVWSFQPVLRHET